MLELAFCKGMLIKQLREEDAMQISTHLSFNGNCEEAFQFYVKSLGAKIVTLMRYEGTPMEKHMPAGQSQKIIHGTISLGGANLMGADAPPDRYEAPKGYTVTIGTNDVAEAERLFNALAGNGTVQMPLQKTYWAERFGMLTDRFGIPWMINCDQKAQ
jgi:PhnB protein